MGQSCGSSGDTGHPKNWEQWAGTMPSGWEGSRSLPVVVVMGTERPLFLTLRSVKAVGFPRLTTPQSSLGTLMEVGEGGFVWLSPIRWSLKESPLGGAP